MRLGFSSPEVRFQAGWTTHDVVRQRTLAPGVEVFHWRAVRQSGEVAWIASYPCDEHNFRIHMVLNRIPRHVGLPLTSVLEAYETFMGDGLTSAIMLSCTVASSGVEPWCR